MIFSTLFLVEFRETVYNYGEAFQKGVFTAPFKGFYTFYGQMRSNVSFYDYISIWLTILIFQSGWQYFYMNDSYILNIRPQPEKNSAIFFINI